MCSNFLSSCVPFADFFKCIIAVLSAAIAPHLMGFFFVHGYNCSAPPGFFLVYIYKIGLTVWDFFCERYIYVVCCFISPPFLSTCQHNDFSWPVNCAQDSCSFSVIKSAFHIFISSSFNVTCTCKSSAALFVYSHIYTCKAICT